MTIEYERGPLSEVWNATLNGEEIGWIVANTETIEGESICSFHAHAGDIASPPIPGGPFASLNQAKAALEYHFRNLTEEQNAA